ncbi:transmembrane protein 167 precursor, putative [Entamoeba invadens IP1]|uniref:Protein kish n=1 Tax=Entamoeba invadens IP1 TaxID=370355 RepID=A0A0A1UF18_ENTIV|nr:transmembrane protein 167 precursor, putative [Entamoeba invadens IP1]ELP91386.1 transmembrane protein 167 precursor, putative [Entamoeba invadens IP1]|eukprot:XP_004258157.1 transmembrane protein 167 precursor, putative [Entamoeba invadens IP1]
MTALFNFQSMMVVIILFVCTCTYLRLNIGFIRNFMDKKKEGVPGMMWKAARLGERASPWVSLSCIALGIATLIWQQ